MGDLGWVSSSLNIVFKKNVQHVAEVASVLQQTRGTSLLILYSSVKNLFMVISIMMYMI